MTINIATIGSFITNDNFNSRFNPYYKQFFNVVAQETYAPITNDEMSCDFFNQLKDKQPKYLILDFLLDVFHCWRNDSSNFDRYFEHWKISVQQLMTFLKNEMSDCHVILVQGHLPDTFIDGSSMTTYCEENNIAQLNIEKMNKQWETLNRYFCEQCDVEVLNLTTNYQLDKMYMTTTHGFHFETKFYNSFLNQLISMTYQRPVMDVNQALTTQRIYLNEDYELLQTKQVEVVLNSDENIIKLAREGQKEKNDVYRLYKTLLKNDYMLHAHENGVSKLYQRRYVDELWDRNDLNRVGDVYYTLDEPINAKDGKAIKNKKLIVIFPCMPKWENFFNPSITERMFNKFYNGIESKLTKNVYTMRIMDLNVTYGSHFINTDNNETLERDISHAIIEVKEKLNLQDNDIVLYGASKGGTGALYYGAKLDLKCLAVDPIIHLGQYNENDTHFLRGMRTVDLSDQINAYLSQGSKLEKYIIGSENIAFNFKYISKITGTNVTRLNKKDEKIKIHSDVSRNTVMEALMFLNKMLLNKRLFTAVFYLSGMEKKLRYLKGVALLYKTMTKIK
ncbi:accessory Sec system protein Asp2 [Staphylococcus microti]|uniref:Accessory Sec system protein Asp2 n=1 Tax=Staphylococcus microti TaxID=569857 RepID=A0A380GR59_9STAP|nr:accessory Sec system protein Asp2 [Staphylococcus microti]PNZ81465.1 hypothetical protein CD132_06485 [Staphylococcus microti]SUM56906.1 accessory Sec system protein Asp2 [Staphylococcus microti]